MGGNGQIYWRYWLKYLPLLGLREPMKQLKEVILGSEQTSNYWPQEVALERSQSLIGSVWINKKQLVSQGTFENNRAIQLAISGAEQLDVEKENQKKACSNQY